MSQDKKEKRAAQKKLITSFERALPDNERVRSVFKYIKTKGVWKYCEMCEADFLLKYFKVAFRDFKSSRHLEVRFSESEKHSEIFFVIDGKGVDYRMERLTTKESERDFNSRFEFIKKEIDSIF